MRESKLKSRTITYRTYDHKEIEQEYSDKNIGKKKVNGNRKIVFRQVEVKPETIMRIIDRVKKI
jgi:hypothetical protein